MIPQVSKSLPRVCTWMRERQCSPLGRVTLELPENIFPVTGKSVSKNKANVPTLVQQRDEERVRAIPGCSPA